MILHEKTAFGPTKLMIHMGNAGSNNISSITGILKWKIDAEVVPLSWSRMAAELRCILDNSVMPPESCLTRLPVPVEPAER